MIKIICCGKLKESYFIDAVKEYQKRIGKYHKLEIIEVKDSTIEEERNLILKHINKKDYIITLEILGNKLNSEELANKIDKTLLEYSTITFIIGGSYGLHDDIKKISDFALSFSDFTFPHQMFRVMLLEQIYRSFKILNHETYHK